jgi:glycerate kinase
VFGKVPVGIARRAKKYGLPVLAITGGISNGAEAVYDYGVDSMMSIVNKPMTLAEAIESSEYLLEQAAERAMRILKTGLSAHKT